MEDSASARLTVLQTEVGARIAQMQRSHGPWPCAAGCDACCRRLGALPQLTKAEFVPLWRAIEAMPDAAAVVAAIASAEPNAQGHWTCPLLDAERGQCRVYDVRPIACRTYGFYAGREGDYWCEQVTGHLGARRDTLVAGNQAAIDRRRGEHTATGADLAEHVAARQPTR